MSNPLNDLLQILKPVQIKAQIMAVESSANGKSVLRSGRDSAIVTGDYTVGQSLIVSGGVVIGKSETAQMMFFID